MEARDWSSLLPELLNRIARQLNEISDFVRFRAVCTAWRSATTLANLPLQFPWILEGRSYLDSEPDLSFYSIPFGKIYTIQAPNSSNRLFIHGSSDGYFFFGSPRFSLLNPLNNHEIPLPAPHGIQVCSYRIEPWRNQMGVHAVCRCTSNYKDTLLVSCHLGQNNWHKIDLGLNCYHGKLFYLNSMIFSVRRDTGVTEAIDIASATVAYVVPPVEGYSGKGEEYIVDASGDILRVSQLDEFHGFYYRIDVHRLTKSGSGSVSWVKIDNIGNKALFLDMYGCFALRAVDFAGIKRNCIYILRIKKLGIRYARFWVERRDIETGAQECLTCPLQRPCCWFVPGLQRL